MVTVLCNKLVVALAAP
nr:hypothetical protein [Vibrio vulnificus]